MSEIRRLEPRRPESERFEARHLEANHPELQNPEARGSEARVSESGQAGPRRPDPGGSWWDRLHDRSQDVRERLREQSKGFGGRRADRRASVTAPIDAASSGRTSPSLALTALLAVGSAVLALAGLWAWQSWSNRSSEPIDALLPMLVESAPESSTAPADTGNDDSSSETSLDHAEAPAIMKPGQASTQTFPDAVTPAVQIIVHVSGAVAEPGVVRLAPEARVFEAVAEAGGATRAADLDRVNLAALVVDGERIHVPTVGEDPLPVVPSSRPPVTAAADDGQVSVLDINAATATDLETLPGIGPAIAEAIVRTREDRGPFLSVDELLDVPGIGDAKLALLAPHVVIGN